MQAVLALLTQRPPAGPAAALAACGRYAAGAGSDAVVGQRRLDDVGSEQGGTAATRLLARRQANVANNKFRSPVSTISSARASPRPPAHRAPRGAVPRVSAALGSVLSADDYTFKLVKKGAECASSDTYHGKKPTLEGCARAVAEHKRSAYFIYGSGTDSKAGDCFSEATRTAACQEGFEDDSFDFYEMSAEWIGCMEPRSSNYDSKALVDSGECTEADACVTREGDGTCRIGNGATRQPVDGGFIGYRNRANDTVYASRVENRAIESGRRPPRLGGARGGADVQEHAVCQPARRGGRLRERARGLAAGRGRVVRCYARGLLRGRRAACLPAHTPLPGATGTATPTSRWCGASPGTTTSSTWRST